MIVRNLKQVARSISLSNNQQGKYLFSRVDTSVSKDAKKADIKSTFFKLAKKYHPDTNPSAGDKFREINEAYQVLSDESKKSEYDQLRSSDSGQRSYTSSSNKTQQNPFKSTSYQDTEELFKKYTQQAQNQNGQNKNFHYYWESQNSNRSSNNNAQGQYQQHYQQANKYQQQREQERRQEEMRMHNAMNDFVKNMYQGKNPKFNEFTNTYNKGRPYNTQQQFANDPHDYYQFDTNQQAKQYQQNNNYQQQYHFNNQQYNPRSQDNRYSENPQRIYEEQMKERYREELRRQKEYEDWQKQKDEMFMKEVDEKVQQFKNNVKDAGKKVEDVANKAEQVAKDLGSKVMSFFKKK